MHILGDSYTNTSKCKQRNEVNCVSTLYSTNLWGRVQAEGLGLCPGDNTPHLLPRLWVVTIEQEAIYQAAIGLWRHIRL